MAISQPFQHSYKRFIDAAKSLDQSQPKPTPQQPTWNTLPKSSQQAADERERQRRYALGALEGECDKLALAPPTTRHQRRLNAAIALGGFVRDGHLSEQEIEAALFSARIPESNVQGERQTIRDGIRYGEAKPRDIPPPRNPLVPSAIHPAAADDADLMTQLRDAPQTDAGNAECLALLYADVFRYDKSRKKWLEWNGTRWIADADGAVHRATTLLARTRQAAFLTISDSDKRLKAMKFGITSENTTRSNALLAQAIHLEAFETMIEQYDRNNWLAGTLNGTLDLRTRELRAADRGEYITKQLGTAVDPAATAARWLRFIDEVFAGDAELIAYIQRAVGYSLTGDTREQKLFLCYGGGANGKSVFLDVLAALLGDYAATASFDTFDAGHRTDATNDLAALKGARLVTVIETDEDRRLSEARVKSVTGQDPISCRFLYGEFFTYRPTFKLWFAMNHKPGIRGTDRGIWRRVKLIPFTQNFEGREDKRLKEKLLEELPGILNWALVGLRHWQEQGGIGTAQAVETATDEYRIESDLVAQWLGECCDDEAEVHTPASTLYDSYRTWCKSYGYREPTATALGRSLVEKGYPKTRTKRGNVYVGLRLAEPTDASPSFTVGDVGHDQRATTQARLWLRNGEYAKAAEVARTVRGNREQQALLQEIYDAEREAKG